MSMDVLSRARRALLPAAAFSCALAACGGGSSIPGPVDGDRAMAHVRHLVEQIGPRPFGSKGLEQAADYIRDELKKLGLEPRLHTQTVAAEGGKTIRNVYVQIDGEDPQDGKILMIGAHYDTKLTEGHGDPAHNFPFVGAIDGGGAPAVLLELARVLQQRATKPKPNIWLYWIDAEESVAFHWDNDRALIGSKAFVKMLDKEGILPRVKAFVLLDLIGDKDLKIDRDNQSNEQLQQIFEKVAKEQGVEDTVYRYRSGATDDHTVFRDHGVPSVLLIDFQHRVPYHLRDAKDPTRDDPSKATPEDQRYAKWWHTPEDTLDKMSPRSLAFAGNLVMAALPDLEAFVMARK